jgi:methyltransferase-like protein/cyclopropane fatty-acyl-phospholipid synthase-like methyltransferase
MKPAPVEQCRVLEIGCFDGVNLAAMAVGLPDCEFIGVDAAGTAIARGRALAEEIGLKNLTLRHLDLMEMAPDYGKFDYIIVHGVYSWVPEPVREQILAICKGSLAPQGVAYISYNAFPGCHNRVMIREIMQFHNRDFHDPQQQMQQGMSLLKVLASSLQDETEPYAMALKVEVKRLSGSSLESLYHDELAEVFTPFYFHEFMDQARRHDLQFLAEVDFYHMVPLGLKPEAVEILDKMGDDVILKEQYLDFMRGRYFRRTLLCHPDVSLNRKLEPDCVRSYNISTFSKPQSPAPNPEPGAQETFENQTGGKVASADPLARALYWYLIDKNPERISFQRLATEVELRARQQYAYAPEPDHDNVAEIAEIVFGGYRTGMLELHIHVPPYVVHVSDKPLASPLARCQVRRGDPVSTLHHRTVRLADPVLKGLVVRLDGTRDHTALRLELLQAIESGKMDLLDGEGKPMRDMSMVSKVIEDGLERILQSVARMAVLVG